jgi:hypothetical protein
MQRSTNFLLVKLTPFQNFNSTGFNLAHQLTDFQLLVTDPNKLQHQLNLSNNRHNLKNLSSLGLSQQQQVNKSNITRPKKPIDYK